MSSVPPDDLRLLHERLDPADRIRPKPKPSPYGRRRHIAYWNGTMDTRAPTRRLAPAPPLDPWAERVAKATAEADEEWATGVVERWGRLTTKAGIGPLEPMVLPQAERKRCRTNLVDDRTRYTLPIPFHRSSPREGLVWTGVGERRAVSRVPTREEALLALVDADGHPVDGLTWPEVAAQVAEVCGVRPGSYGYHQRTIERIAQKLRPKKPRQH
jgi:hypothetical protein